MPMVGRPPTSGLRMEWSRESEWAPGALRAAHHFATRSLTDDLRTYVVWRIAEERSWAGIHSGIGDNAYVVLLDAANYDFNLVKFRRCHRGFDEALSDYRMGSYEHGVPIRPHFFWHG